MTTERGILDKISACEDKGHAFESRALPFLFSQLENILGSYIKIHEFLRPLDR